MEIEPFENPWIKKIRLLTKLLVLSVASNIGFMTFLLYSEWGGKEEALEKRSSRLVTLGETNGRILKQFFSLSMRQLVDQLIDASTVEDGFSKRDLALACLVNYHYFDVKKAVSGAKLQKRVLTFVHQMGGEVFTLDAFSGLTDEHFEMILNFAAKERWPLTAEGLFYLLQKETTDKEEGLISAFLSTPEFYAIYTLFNRGKEKVSVRSLLEVLLRGGWEEVKGVLDLQLKEPDSGFELVRVLLSKYVEKRSKAAALLWIQLDAEYLQRKLDDTKLYAVLELIEEETPGTTLLLKQILSSVRSDAVRKMAATKLYRFAQEELPEPYEHELALKKFLPALFAGQPQIPVKKEEPPLPKPKRIHKVEDGDSLWKIARRYKVTIEGIKKENRITSDHLKKGQELTIPDLEISSI